MINNLVYERKRHIRSTRPEVLSRKVFLEISQNSQEITSARLKKEALAQLFSCEFYEISKDTFSYRTPLVAASNICQNKIFSNGLL